MLNAGKPALGYNSEELLSHKKHDKEQDQDIRNEIFL